MDEKVIIAKFGKTKVAQTEKQWRYNHGQKLKFEGVDLPANYEVHFSNSKTGEAKTVIGNADGALIPHEYFAPGSMIYAWVYVEEDGTGITKREVRIPIDQKARPTDQQPLPEEQTVVEQAIEALNNAVEEIPTDIAAALAEAKASGLYDGTNIWWTYERISSGVPDYDGGVRKRDLHGKDREAPLVGDLVYGPDVRSDGVITDLYVIAHINGPLVYLTHLDRIVGNDGFSPEVEIEPITNGHRVTITDAEGPESFDVMNGEFDVTGDLSMENHRLTELADGVDDTDAVNKAQVERMVREGSGLFRGSFSTKASLNMAAWQSTDPTQPYYVDNNDYCVVLSDETRHYECWRYGYVVGSGWSAQYRINEAPMTTAQIAAINSGITADRLVGLEQFKNVAQPKLSGIEVGAQVNKIETIRAWDSTTGEYINLPIINKIVIIPRQGATIFDFVYDLNNDIMVSFPTLDEVQAAATAATNNVIARFKYYGDTFATYIPLGDNYGDFFGVIADDTAARIFYSNNQWYYETLPLICESNVFFAIYDTTTSAEIEAAYQAGKAIFCIQHLLPGEDYCFPLWYKTGSNYHEFAAASSGVMHLLICDNDVWSSSYKNCYVKPSGGIPKNDLASTVKASLGKADTALQSYTETDPTVPSWAKASSKPSYTASEVGAVASNQGVAHAGEFVVVGSDGNITTVTMSVWQGGSF